METFRVPKGFDTSPIGVLEQIRLEVIRQASLHAVEVVVKRFQKKRSDEQNRYLWGCVYPAILAHLPGWDAEDVHEFCLGEWSGWELMEGLGRKRLRPIKRSSKLSTMEFMDFVGHIQRTMAEKGIVIPDPNEHLESAA